MTSSPMSGTSPRLRRRSIVRRVESSARRSRHSTRSDVPPSLPDSATIEQIALANRPELRQFCRNQQQGAASVDEVSSNSSGIPTSQSAVAARLRASRVALFTLGISLPLPTFYWQHARGDIAQAQHFERELEATYRDARAQVTQDVRSAYANASTAMRQVVFLRDQLVPAASEAYRVASTSYSLGGSSALEVLTARSALLDAQRQLADALAAANTARADLDRALGASTPDAPERATDEHSLAPRNRLRLLARRRIRRRVLPNDAGPPLGELLWPRQARRETSR